MEVTFNVEEKIKGVPSGRYLQLQYGDTPATTKIDFENLSEWEVRKPVDRG